MPHLLNDIPNEYLRHQTPFCPKDSSGLKETQEGETVTLETLSEKCSKCVRQFVFVTRIPQSKQWVILTCVLIGTVNHCYYIPIAMEIRPKPVTKGHQSPLLISSFVNGERKERSVQSHGLKWLIFTHIVQQTVLIDGE